MWEVDRKSVKVMDTIGKGNFGLVSKGVVSNLVVQGCSRGTISVAVKQCAGRGLTLKDRQDFMSEVSVMMLLSEGPGPAIAM